MGNKGSKSSKKKTQHLEQRTRDYVAETMTRTEVMELKKFWIDMYPSGECTSKDFFKFASKAAINYDAEAIAYMFRLLDQDKNGTITFLEFLWFQCLNGTRGDREKPPISYLVEMSFCMYDEDGDGFLTREELKNTMVNVMKVNGHNTNDADVKDSIENRVNHIFQQADANGDGKLTKKEILDAWKVDNTIYDYL